MKSLSKKLDTSRHGFEEHPHTTKDAGAFGKDELNAEHTANRESAAGSTREAKSPPPERMKKS